MSTTYRDCWRCGRPFVPVGAWAEKYQRFCSYICRHAQAELRHYWERELDAYWRQQARAQQQQRGAA